MSDSETIRAVLREHIHDASSQWNLGTFGAIAEFMRDPGEEVVIVDKPSRLSATTARGGIGFDNLDGAPSSPRKAPSARAGAPASRSACWKTPAL